MKSTFADSRLAYTLEVGPPPTIVPAATPEEGAAVVKSLQLLRQAGLNGSAAHLRKASECINEGDWAGSVRESIHAVESVARKLDLRSSADAGAGAEIRSSDAERCIRRSRRHSTSSTDTRTMSRAFVMPILARRTRR